MLAAVRPQSALNGGEDTSSTDEEVAATPTGDWLACWQERKSVQTCTLRSALHHSWLPAASLPAAGAHPAARRHMTPQMRRAVASLLLRLAGKAQFAKVNHLVFLLL